MQITGHTNIDEILAVLDELEAKGQDLSPVFEDIGGELWDMADEALENEASPDGEAWEPLSPLTIERKGHGRKLDDSGDMRQSLEFDSDNQSVTIGTNAVSDKGYPYPAVHQFGTQDGKIPARPFLPFNDDGDLMDEAAGSVLGIVQEYFEG